MKNFFLTNPLETFKSFSYNLDVVHFRTPGIDWLSDLGPFAYWDFVKIKTAFVFAFIFLLFWSAGSYLRLQKILSNGYFYAIICVILTNFVFSFFYIQPVQEFFISHSSNISYEDIFIQLEWLAGPLGVSPFPDEVEYYEATKGLLDEEALRQGRNLSAVLDGGPENIENGAIWAFWIDFVEGLDDFQPFQETKNVFGKIEFEGVFTFHFEKEIISFLSFCILAWLLSISSGQTSSGYVGTLFFPKTILGHIDEMLYRKNLILFTDTLQMKHEKEVKKFQEFFIIAQGILLFILIANVQGMVPYSSTITSSLINTLYISLAVFATIILTLIKEKGYQHFFSLFLPKGCPFPLIFLLNPIEFISYVFRLISLSVRLFANMMAGHTLMKVILGFSWSLLLLGDNYVIVHYIPFFVLFILTVLELAVGFIQTYIFVVLVYIYLSDVFTGH